MIAAAGTPSHATRADGLGAGAGQDAVEGDDVSYGDYHWTASAGKLGRPPRPCEPQERQRQVLCWDAVEGRGAGVACEDPPVVVPAELLDVLGPELAGPFHLDRPEPSRVDQGHVHLAPGLDVEGGPVAAAVGRDA